MTKNLMPRIAEMVGVELGEEFNIKVLDGSEDWIQAYLDKSGLVVVGEYARNANADKYLAKLIAGKVEYKKQPWEPKFGEPYWTISFSTNFTVRVIKTSWEKDCVDFALLRLGMVYRTMQEATDHMAEDYERLTGSKLHENAEKNH